MRKTTGNSGPTAARRPAAKAAELASALGAIALGAGLALLAPLWLRGYGSTLLLAGAAVHGLGMSLKFGIEERDGGLRWWERGLFWLCWVVLGGLGVWIAVQFAMLPSSPT